MYAAFLILGLLYGSDEAEEPKEKTFAGFVVQVSRIQRIINLDEPDKVSEYVMLYVYTPAERNEDQKTIAMHVVRVENDTPVRIGIDEGSIKNIHLGAGVEIVMRGSTVKKVIIMSLSSKKGSK
jgi:uncharacterized OB-fold protein